MGDIDRIAHRLDMGLIAYRRGRCWLGNMAVVRRVDQRTHVHIQEKCLLCFQSHRLSVLSKNANISYEQLLGYNVFLECPKILFFASLSFF